MNITCFFHGKLRDTYRFPSKVETNDDFLEKLKDETFGESTTYSIISEKKQLMIASLRKWKGQSLSVFTYFITSHDAANRPGGYIAITVIIQDYLVSDREKMYSIFEEAYSKLQLEQVLDNKKIFIETFDEKKAFFESLMDDITTCISNICKPFVPIPEYSKDGEPTAFNVEDCNSDTFINALKESGISYVSKNIISMKENNEFKEKYEQALATIQQLKNKVDNKATSSAGKSKKENDIIQKLQEENNKLKQSNDSLKQQIDNVVAVIESVDKKVHKTQGIVAKSAQKISNSDSPWIRFSIVFPIINTILLAVLLSLVLSNLNGLKKNLDNDFINVRQEPLTGILGIQEDSTTVEIKEDRVDSENTVQVVAQSVQESIESKSTPKTQDVKISITNQKGETVVNGGKVSPNDILNVTCNNPNAKGYEVYTLGACTKTDKGIMILSTEKSAKIYFCHPDDKDVPFEKQLNKRTFTINKAS